MNFVNMQLFKADIQHTKLPSGKIKATLTIKTNGHPVIGSYRIPDDGYGERELNISNGTKSIFEDVDVFSNRVFCMRKDKKFRFNSNFNSDEFIDARGDKAVYLIAIPFRKRIVNIIASKGVTIQKTCFTSFTQSKAKKYTRWAPEGTDKKQMKKFEYPKTLYIVAEADISKCAGTLPEDVIGHIKVFESAMRPEDAQYIIKTHETTKVYTETEVSMHVINVPLRFNPDDYDPTLQSVTVMNDNLYPSDFPVETVKLSGIEACSIATAITNKTTPIQHEPV